MLDLAFASKLLEPQRNLDIPPNVVVPPVKLDEVETLHAQAAERLLDDGPDVAPGDRSELGEIRHDLGVDPQRVQRLGAALRGKGRAEIAVEVLDAHVDVGAVEGGDAGIEGRDQVLDRDGPVDRAVA